MQSARNKDTSAIITVTFRSLRNQAEVVTHFCSPWRELSGSTIFTPFYTDSQGHRTFSFWYQLEPITTTPALTSEAPLNF